MSSNTIQPFTTIGDIPLFSSQVSNYGTQQLNQVDEIQAGYGDMSFKVDSQGLWLGAETFAQAPFSVTMAGAMKSVSASVGSGAQVVIQNGAILFINSLGQIIGIIGDEAALT